MDTQKKPPVWNITGAPMEISNADVHVVILMKRSISAEQAVLRMRDRETEFISRRVTRAAINKMMGK